MSLAVIRSTLRKNRRPFAMGYYQPLLVATVARPTVSRIGLAQIPLKSFSTSMIRFNNEQIGKPSTTVANTKAVEANAQVSNDQSTKPPSSRIGKFIQQSKELIKFYKDGLKQLWANNKEAKALQLKVNNEGYELNRSEFQLIHQSKKDMLKLIPFGFVFMILPESIPLLVMYVPGMVPGTCLKDSQIQKQRQKLNTLRQKMTRNVLESAQYVQGISPKDFLSLSKFQKLEKHYAYDFDLSRIDRRHLKSYCRYMGINDYGTRSILRNRLTQYMEYLDQDDKLLVKEELVDRLTLDELSHAVEERGMKSVNEAEDNLRRGLKYWLSLTQPPNPQDKIKSGLLVFSRMFLLNANYQGKHL
ncbi:hypothetical protein [Parasitella parasitica]|uniref:Letm1 RBD domain-containing protein n=1 Tax=Parasitella parasitica TaxID=35722 RepID=A0A0B7N8C2_9FUNG|nr:hypothetical protein [Parasitella parasitica]